MTCCGRIGMCSGGYARAVIASMRRSHCETGFPLTKTWVYVVQLPLPWVEYDGYILTFVRVDGGEFSFCLNSPATWLRSIR